MTQIVKKGEIKQVPEDMQSLIPRGIAKNDAQHAHWVDLTKQINDTKQWLSGHVNIDGFVVPRFGVLSLKAATTPMYVYSHPAFKKICNTGFTDGIHIFICDEFLDKLNQDVDKSKGEDYGLETLILHELMHMMFNHTRRLRQFPHDIANRAEDLYINTKLSLAFPEIKWCQTLREIGLGFKKGDLEKYPFLAEETIARELMAEQKKQQGDGQGQGKGQGNQQGKGQGQGQQGKGQGQGQPQQGQGNQQGKGQGDKSQQGNQPGGQGGNKDSEGNDWSDQHTIRPEELIEVMEEAGLQKIIEKLNLPSSDDLEKIAEIEETGKLKDIESIQKSSAQKAQMGGKYPGAHIVDAASDMIKGFVEGKIQWKLGLKEFILGDGMKFRYNDEEPSDIFYVQEVTDFFGNEIYLGQDLPHNPQEVVLCLIDTSGSVSDAQLKAFFSEIFELKEANTNMGDAASEVIVLSGDTVLRGEPIEINAANVDQLMREGMKIYGRGGTDFATVLKQTMKLPLLHEKKVQSVVYFTDLFDTPPKPEDFPDGVRVCFVAAPNTAATHVEEFSKAVKSWARVYVIEEGMEADLSDTMLETAPVAPRKMKS